MKRKREDHGWDLVTEDFSYKGSLKEDGTIEGKGVMEFPDGSQLIGTFSDGDPHGQGKYVSADGSTIFGTYEHGDLTGQVTETNESGGLVYEEVINERFVRRISRFATPWQRCNGEFRDGVFDGKENIYHYPSAAIGRITEGSFLLKGEWRQGDMASAVLYRGADEALYNGKRVVYAYDPSDSVRISSKPTLPDLYEQSLSGGGTILPPPPVLFHCCVLDGYMATFRVENVVVGPSSVGSNAGEGLFARVELPSGRIVSYYNGTRVRQDVVDARAWEENSNTITLIEGTSKRKARGRDNHRDSNDDPEKKTKEHSPRDKCIIKKDGVDDEDEDDNNDDDGENEEEEEEGEEEKYGDYDDDDREIGLSIDVPKEYALTTHYCASLGHKVNHSFDEKKVNCEYAHCDHPRFGQIRCIKTLRPIKKGEELLVSYGYDILNVTATYLPLGDGVPDWFLEGYKKFSQLSAESAPEQQEQQ
eukprot:jgi/Bigna1/90901/estExt_fgenesh1_pg.C_820051